MSRRTVVIVASALLIVAPFLPAFAGEEPDREQLKAAKRLLVGPQEGVVRRGAQSCLKQDNAPAADLLLEALNRSQPHYRDIVWEVLPKLADPYARKRVAYQVRTNKKNPRVRQWCAQALGLFGDPIHATTLMGALTAKQDYVRAAAITSLGQLKHEPARAKLERAARDKSALVRARAVEALVRIDPERAKEWFGAALDEDDPEVRCFALGSLPEFYPALTEQRSVHALGDTDWRPRMQAVENLITLRTKTALDALVDATDDERPVVGRRAMTHLAELSGKQFTLPEQWRLWWDESRKEFEFPPLPDPEAEDADAKDGDAKDGTRDDAGTDDEKAAEKETERAPSPGGDSTTHAAFEGLPVESDHVAFIIDKSISMKGPAGGGSTKDEAARKALDETLTSVTGRFVFNVFTFGADPQGMSKDPVVLTEKTRKQAAAFVKSIAPKGRKNIWEILELVVADPRIDTIYLLSSGEPEVGLYVHWNRVTEHLIALNRRHRVTVHTVVWSQSKWYRDQLEKLAECTGGRFIARD
jgi:hypothetical protein